MLEIKRTNVQYLSAGDVIRDADGNDWNVSDIREFYGRMEVSVYRYIGSGYGFAGVSTANDNTHVSVMLPVEFSHDFDVVSWNSEGI